MSRCPTTCEAGPGAFRPSPAEWWPAQQLMGLVGGGGRVALGVEATPGGVPAAAVALPDHSSCSGTEASGPLLFSSCFSGSRLSFGRRTSLPPVIRWMQPAHPAPLRACFLSFPHLPLVIEDPKPPSQPLARLPAPHSPLPAPSPPGAQRLLRSSRGGGGLEPSGQNILRTWPTYSPHLCHCRETEAGQWLEVAGETPA